ncbi:MAG: hypothetical protein NTY35_02380 [Planctomycetota bacterium]|nr:hypothetical protein [Planctomycetota bacterium]
MNSAVAKCRFRVLANACARGLLVVALCGLARGQCNTWENLGALGYLGDVANGLEVEPDSGDLVYASTEPPAPHGPYAHVFRRLGSAWVDITPSDVANPTIGKAGGLRILDAGAGPRLHVFGRRGSQTGYVRRLDGLTWATPVPDAPSDIVDLAVFDFGTGPEYVVVRASGALERFHSGAWTTLGGLSDATPSASLIVHASAGSQTLYVASGSGVARWDAGAWTSLGVLSNSYPNYGPRLRSLTTNSGTHLYLAGHFTAVGGVPANGLARWNGSSWQGLGQPGLATNDVAAFDAGNGSGTQLYAWIAGIGFARQETAGWTTFPSPSGTSFSSTVLGRGVRAGSGGRPELWVSGSADWPGNGDSIVYAWSSCASAGEIGCAGDGVFAACPCANESAASARAGCLNSLGLAASLRGSGIPSLTGGTFVLSGASMTNSSALYFQGASFHAPSPLGDGLKCVGGPFIRLATRANVAGTSSYPAAGEVALSKLGNVQSPGVRHYQVRYRNTAAFCTPEPFNYTNSLTVVWQP